MGPHQGMVILENGTFLVSVFHQLHCLVEVPLDYLAYLD